MTKEHGATKEEVEGPTSSWGLRNRITLLTLQEHDDDEKAPEVMKDCTGFIFK